MTGIEKAIQAAGSQIKLAAMLGVKQPVIAHWKKQGWMPTPRAQQCADLFGIDMTELVRLPVAMITEAALEILDRELCRQQTE